MTDAREIIAKQVRWGEVDRVSAEVADNVMAALHTAGSRILGPDEVDRVTLEKAAMHLSEIAQAMWDRCETKRPDDPSQIGEGEEEDATTAWCFDRAAEAVRALGRKA